MNHGLESAHWLLDQDGGIIREIGKDGGGRLLRHRDIIDDIGNPVRCHPVRRKRLGQVPVGGQRSCPLKIKVRHPRYRQAGLAIGRQMSIAHDARRPDQLVRSEIGGRGPVLLCRNPRQGHVSTVVSLRISTSRMCSLNITVSLRWFLVSVSSTTCP